MDEAPKNFAGGSAGERRGARADVAAERRLACLRALERKVLWLAIWMIHDANHRQDEELRLAPDAELFVDRISRAADLAEHQDAAAG